MEYRTNTSQLVIALSIQHQIEFINVTEGCNCHMNKKCFEIAY